MAAQRKTSRREFLRGQSAAEAVSAWADQVVPASDEPASESPSSAAAASSPAYLVHVSRSAMACEFQVYLNAGQHEGATERAIEALDLVAQLEDQLSVFREQSEVSRLNRTAAVRPVAVEPRLFTLLEQALQLHRETEGAFDITSTALSKTWGFLRRQGRFPTQQEVDEALEQVGSQHVQLDSARRTVQFLRPGLEVNLGAIGKGYALDRCAEHLLAEGVNDFVLHGGHSSILARGSRVAQSPEQTGWIVALRHPLRQEQRLVEVRLVDQALGTSGTANQFFHYQGRRYGHILDPRTGWPIEGVLSATVLAPSAAEADALATAFFVLGPEPTQRYVANHPSIAVLMLVPGQRAGTTRLLNFGVPEDQLRLVQTDLDERPQS